MSAIYLATTLVQVYKSIRYIDCYSGKEQSRILLIATETELPKKIKEDYDIVHTSRSANADFPLLSLWYRIQGLRYDWRAVKKAMADLEDDVEVFCFVDNSPRIATYIERIAEKYRNRTRFTLMEDGAALYETDYPFANAVISKGLRKMLYRLSGLSLYSSELPPLGTHPLITRMIVSSPEIMRERFKYREDLSVEQQIEIYTPEFSSYLISACSDVVEECQIYDFIFLTQPIYSDLVNENVTMEQIDAFIHEMSKIVSKYGRLLIKNHPRDSKDYGTISAPYADVCPDSWRIIPYECLIESIGHPAVLSLFSTVSVAEQEGGPVYYLYPLLNLESPRLLSEDYILDNGITIVHYFEELERVLKETSNN